MATKSFILVLALFVSACSTGPKEYLNKEEIRKVVKSHEGEMKTCHEAELKKKKNFRARVTMRFKVLADGKPSEVWMASGPFARKEFVSCVTGVFEKMTFPKPPDKVTAAIFYPVQFNPPKK